MRYAEYAVVLELQLVRERPHSRPIITISLSLFFFIERPLTAWKLLVNAMTKVADDFA